MTQILEFYKCNICGNLVEIVLPGAGELVCCGQPMERLREQTQNEEMLKEKHVPVIEKIDDGVQIRIGSIPHPMEDNHYIMFIEANSDDKKYVKRKYLYPHEEPVMKMKCECNENLIAREFCNIHGLWMSEKDLKH